ncbi:MAG: DUF2313 domain-containing protein [Clostridia bacterium]|nr:DUF2313 domain-containing protein [Clostridia bacterium]
MANKTLYPIYITSHDEYEGNILSSNGTGSARWLIDVGDKSREIGIIAFDTKLRALSKACTINSYKVTFNQKHGNGFAGPCDWVLTPKLITNAYVSGDIITVYSSTDYGSQGRISNNDLDWTDEQVTFFTGIEDSQLAGYSDRYVGFHLSMERDGDNLNLREYMSDLKAEVVYTQRYYANFYAEDGVTLLSSQTVNGGNSPSMPAVPTKAGYDFLGWQYGSAIYSDSLPSSVETDISFTAVYRKIPVIISSSSAGGSITPSGTNEVAYGSSQTYIITPDEGCYIKKVTVDGVSKGQIDSFDFTDVTSDHEIYAEFARLCNVSFSAHSNGKILYSVNSGEYKEVPRDNKYLLTLELDTGKTNTLEVYAIADEGYEFGRQSLVYYYEDGSKQTIEKIGLPSVTINLNSSRNWNFDISFEKIVYPITLETDGNGTLSGAESVSYQESAVYTVTPNDHYVIKDILLDGVSILSDAVLDGVSAQYTLQNVSAEHTISATFQRVVYLTFEAGSNGSISGETVINYGENTYCTITADEGYSIDKIYIDGEEVYQATLAVSSLSVPFESLTEDKTLKATFTNDIVTLTVIQPAEGGYIYGSENGSYVSGSEIALEATPLKGWYFTSWSDGNTNSEITFNITENTELTANFEQYGYTVEATVEGNGKVEPETHSANYCDVVTFKAVPDDGYVFSHWEDGSTEAERQYTVTDNASITATFIKGHYEIKAYTNEGGKVSGGGTYEFQTEITLKAEADAGYYFKEWSDGSAAPERNIIVPAGGGEYIAIFKKFEYQVDIHCSIGGKATKSQSVEHGDSLNIEITSDIGYKISNITVDGESVYEMLTATKDGGRYLLTEIKANHTVEVFFSERRYRFSRKLLDYYPPVIRNILDFVELTRVQEPLVGQVWDAISLAYDNQFIDDATEEGIAQWEKDYSIVPSKADTLKQRKQYLKSKWVPNNKYIFEWLKSWLKTVTGDENITEPVLEDYTLKTYLPIGCSYSTILKDMREYVPSNMAINPVLQLRAFEQGLFTGAAFRLRIKETLTSDSIEVTNNEN